MKTKTNDSRPPRSLTTTLAIAFFGLSALVLLISNSLQILLNIQVHQEAIFNQEQFIARGAAITVSNFIEERSTVLSTVGWQVNPNEASSKAQTQLLTSLLVRQRDFHQLVLFDSQNNETARVSRSQGNSAATYARFISLVTGDILAQAKNGQRYISSVYYDEFTGAPLVTIVVPATDALGNFRGTLVAELNLISIWRPVNELKAGETGYVYIVDNQGNLIAFKDADRVLDGENVSQISAVKKFIESPDKSADITPDVETYQGLLGTKVLGTYVPLGTPEWAVVTELPSSEAYSPIVKSLSGSVAVILLMAVLAGITGLMTARRLAMPLVNLTGTASRIASGEMQLQAAVGGAQEIASLAVAFNTMTFQLRELISSLEQRVAERTAELEESTAQIQNRTSQLEAIADVASSVASLHDVDQLLPYITKTISERFGFYHVGIFLLSEDKKFAVLRAANSEGGQKMLARKHQLRVGQEGIVGFSIDVQRARIALDVGEDAVFFNNPDLPATRSEMALPLIIGKDVIGALDVQSEQSNAFSNEDVEVLNTLANQVAVAIENARLFEQSQQALKEIDATFQRYINNEWRQYAAQSKVVGYRAHEDGLEPITDTIQMNGKDAKKSTIHQIPITLRGVTIGNLGIDLGKQSKELSQEESDIIRATAERVALALEGARLLETSQRQAAKEQKIGDITAKIGASVNMRNVLQTAVEELGRSIPGSEVVIQFQSNQDKFPEEQR
jgi:GAF domain-containing protein/HAMP domain-containing protein